MRGLRTALVALAAGLLAAACALPPAGGAPGAAHAAGPLLPQGVIPGGFAVPVGTPPGVSPGALPTRPPQPPTGQYIKLIHPSSVAATGPHLYVVDSGAGALLRFDTVGQSVARVAQVPAIPGTRVKAGPDGSVYVLRPDRGEVLRFTVDGRRLPSFSAPLDILRPSDLVIEPTLNRVWIADSAGGVFAFHPSGRMGNPVVGRGDGFSRPGEGATLLAAGARAVVGIEPSCRCVLVFDPEGRVRARFGEGELVNPVGIALDHHGRTWVIDRGDGQLKIFETGALAQRIPAARLGLTELTAIAIDHQRVYVADGPGGKIGVFALLPPGKTP